MDPQRRRALQERRLFNQRRYIARERREAIEPAWSALEAAGEEFRVYNARNTPSWNPGWIPAGYSYIPWNGGLSDVRWSEDNLGTEELAALARDLLAERLDPDDPMLFVAEGKGWSIGFKRAVFDRHALVLMEPSWGRAYLVAPPAQWLINLRGHSARWKDG